MEDLGRIALFAVIGYLIGSISFARIILALKRPGEEIVRIRTVSEDEEVVLVSHAVGATNVLMTLGKNWGLTTMLLDILKAFIPMILVKYLYPDELYYLFCGIFVLIGHLWPLWFGFQGGGGNSVVMGMIFAVSPLGLLAAMVSGMAIGMFLPTLAFIASVGMAIPWFMLTKGIFSPETYFAVVVTIIYFLGQLPETLQFLRFKKAGHTFDTSHVMKMMKRETKKKTVENEAGKKGSL